MKKIGFSCLLVFLVLGCVKKKSPNKGEALYLKHCASCHHPQRWGKTGPPLLPAFLRRKKDKRLFEIIQNGLPATQMASFSYLKPEQIKKIIGFLRTPGSTSWDLSQVSKSRVLSSQKASPFKIGKISNLTAVVERGTNQIWVMEDDKILQKFFFPSVHGGIKFSRDNSAFFIPSRNGWVGKYDLKKQRFWGKVRAGIYLRNIAISRDGRYILSACWLPKALVILDSRDLKPLKSIGVPGKISAIYSLIQKDQAIFTFRDSPKLGVLDTRTLKITYTDLEEPMEDFFIDPTDRFIIGSSRRGKILKVMDLAKKKIVFRHSSPGMPHLFSAAFWYNKGQFYFATHHMRKPWVSIWRMYQWAFVKKIDIGGDGFFVRTHENTPYLWMDNGSDQIVVLSKRDFFLKKKILFKGQKVLHTEFSGDGKIAYISLFSKKGFLFLLDGATLEVVKKIPASFPVGKYNFKNKQRRFLQSALGREVFMAKCWGCHHSTQKAFGPAFQWIGRHRQPAWIRAQLLNPQLTAKHLGYKRNAMPKIHLNNEEIDTLLAYILSLKKE